MAEGGFLCLLPNPGVPQEGYTNLTGFMYDRELLKNCSVIDGRQQLIRIKDIPKQAQTSGFRNEGSYSQGERSASRDRQTTLKNCVILDDVWTQGALFVSAKKL